MYFQFYFVDSWAYSGFMWGYYEPDFQFYFVDSSGVGVVSLEVNDVFVLSILFCRFQAYSEDFEPRIEEIFAFNSIL